MAGIVHRPHTHTRPALFSSVFNPPGSVWACECGKRWTLSGERRWVEHGLPPRYSDDLAGALAFILDEANRHRRALGLAQVSR